jgi:N6-L-threonylcarbamoyladenine synthase
MSATVRDMRLDDIPAVAALEAASFGDPWSAGAFREELRSPRRAYVVAEDDGVLVGYAGIMLVDDDAHLMNLAVGRKRRGEGIGRALATEAMVRALGMGATRATLEVRPSNTAAIALYQSLGLESVGERPGYYADTGEAALIMWGDLTASSDQGPGSVRASTATATATDEPPYAELILAIESSCDETAAAIMRGGTELVANVVASQIDFHARFGGVVPEIASRKHTEAIVGVIDEALAQAGEALGYDAPLPFSALDAIAVTYGPGLVGALVVGLAYAKGLAMGTGLPLVGVNHLEGHIFANVFADPEVKPPLVALLVSGGHTSLVHMPEWGVYRTMGQTLDDAAGEAFDKVAKVLGMGYPGGPILSRLAETGDPAAIDFPRAMMRSGDYAFSLSGLKTAVINHIRHEQQAGREIDVPDLAASFQQAVIDVQVSKAVRAVKETGSATFCLGGGVAANPALRAALTAAMEPLGVHVSVPPLHLCTDNAAMIAAAAHYRYLRGERLGLDAEPVASLRLDTE